MTVQALLWNVTFPQINPMNAATEEAASTLSLADDSNAASENANDAIKIGIVKPIPASRPTSPTPLHVTPSGNLQMFSLTGAKLASITPTNTFWERLIQIGDRKAHLGVSRCEQGHDAKRYPRVQPNLDSLNGWQHFALRVARGAIA